MAFTGGDEHDDDGVDMVAWQEQMAEDEDQAVALLGGQEPGLCTFGNLDFAKRQAVFACMTCFVKTGRRAGMCFGCSSTCHAGHDIVELWTKRRFRCDCGTPRMGHVPCQLCPKPGDNASNTYNHNFEGQFCHCNRPYPDDTLPEDVNEDMVQCVLCEDWFHTVGFDAAHADVPHPDSDSITHPVSFICGRCHSSYVWLVDRLRPLLLSTPTYDDAGDDDGDGGDEGEKGLSLNAEMHQTATGADAEREQGLTVQHQEGEEQPAKKPKQRAQTDQSEGEGSVQAQQETSESESSRSICFCHVKTADGDNDGGDCSGEDHDVAHRCKHGAFYHGIRQCICACQSCQQLFRERGVDFLHDEEDSQEHFDAIRRQRQQEEQARVAARLMQQLPHRAQMELALAQQHFVQPVLQALRQLTRERQVDVITEDHVREITHAVLQRAQEQQQQQQQQQPQ